MVLDGGIVWVEWNAPTCGPLVGDGGDHCVGDPGELTRGRQEMRGVIGLKMMRLSLKVP